ncbi:MAG TPA: hypothetical protein VK184_11500 [Nostocaceae cyanobacterium]|nr:hypothetical protein [Nostocaceae cyanobacterium]
MPTITKDESTLIMYDDAILMYRDTEELDDDAQALYQDAEGLDSDAKALYQDAMVL